MNHRNVRYFSVFCGIGTLFAVFQLVAPMGILFVTFANVIFVAIYAYLIWKSCDREGDKLSVSERKKWYDSIYFFGFLMTLVSLIIGLYISSDGSNPQLIASKLVQNAIALSSTIAALFFRTYLTLTLVEEEISDEESFLSKELKAMGTAVNDLGKATNRITKNMEETASSVSEHTKNIIAEFNLFAEQSRENHKISLETLFSKVEAAFAPTAAAAKKFEEDVNSIDLDSDVLARAISSATISVLSELSSALTEMETTLQNASNKISLASGELAQSLTDTDFSEIASSKLNEFISPLAEVNRRATKGLNQLRSEAEKTMESAKSLGQQSGELAQENIEEIKAVHSELSKARTLIVKAAERMASRVDKAISSIPTDIDLNELQESLQELTLQLNNLATQAEEFSNRGIISRLFRS